MKLCDTSMKQLQRPKTKTEKNIQVKEKQNNNSIKFKQLTVQSKRKTEKLW